VAALRAHFCELIGAECWPGDIERWFLRIDQHWAPLSGVECKTREKLNSYLIRTGNENI